MTDAPPDVRGKRYVALLAFVGLGTAFVSRLTTMNAYYALTTGRFIVHHGLPGRNVFTLVNAGHVWVDQQWLAHVVFYVTWMVGGYRAVALLSIALVTGGMAILMSLMVRQGVSPARATMWTLVAYVASFTAIEMRPQSFAFVLFPLLLWLVLDDADSPTLLPRTWAALPLLILWSNLHGSVIMAVPVTVLYACYRALRTRGGGRRRYLAFGAAVSLTLIATPYGFAVIGYYRALLGNTSLRRNLPQWAGPSLGRADSWPFFVLAAIAAIAIGVAWRRGIRIKGTSALILAALFVLAARGERFGVWFAMAATVIAAITVEPAIPARSGRRPAVRSGLLSVTTTVLIILVVLVVATASDREFETLTPRAAVDVAARTVMATPGAHLLGDETTGTPALWFHPELRGRIGFDVRFEQYSPRQLDVYFAFLKQRGPTWDAVLVDYDIVVVDRRAHPALAGAMAVRRDWHVVYLDSEGLVAARDR